MSTEECKKSITQMLSRIEEEKVVKLIYEIMRRLFTDRFSMED